MHQITYGVYGLLALAGRSIADCLSYGVDFVDGGGPYCINTTSLDYFTFGTEFFGCQSSDVQGAVTPILIDPNSDEYFCSDVVIQPDGADMVSTCDVLGNELTKSQMFSGDWIVVIEGLTFAWMRTFSIIAGPPVVITSTPTATFTVTSTPSTTLTTTITNVFSTTLPPTTTTVPSTTVTRTITSTPAQVTVYSTLTETRTRTTKVFSTTVSTTTTTTSCVTQPPRRDPTCTIRPTKASLAAASTDSSSALPRMRHYGVGSGQRPGVHPRNAPLAKRGPDLCTTTYLETTLVVSSYTTVTAPTSTEIDTEITSATSTITPPPVTAYSGKAKTTVTVTAATPTRTRTTRVFETVFTTKTVWATITSTVATAPSGWVCVTTAG